MEIKEITTTAKVVKVENTWAYACNDELQTVPAIVTRDNWYINKSPATCISSTLKSVIKLDDIIYLDAILLTENGYVKQSVVKLAWIGKKPKKLPSPAKDFLLHNETVLHDIQDRNQDKCATLVNAKGKLHEVGDNLAEISIFWEPKLKIKLDISEMDATKLNLLKAKNYVNFDAFQTGPAAWTLVRIWTEGVEIKYPLADKIKKPITEVPTLGWQDKNDFIIDDEIVQSINNCRL